MSGHSIGGDDFVVGAQSDDWSGIPGPADDQNNSVYVDEVLLYVKPECYQTMA